MAKFQEGDRVIMLPYEGMRYGMVLEMEKVHGEIGTVHSLIEGHDGYRVAHPNYSGTYSYPEDALDFADGTQKRAQWHKFMKEHRNGAL